MQELPRLFVTEDLSLGEIVLVDFFHYRRGINCNSILLCANQLQSKRSIISETGNKTFQYSRIYVCVYYLLSIASAGKEKDSFIKLLIRENAINTHYRDKSNLPSTNFPVVGDAANSGKRNVLSLLTLDTTGPYKKRNAESFNKYSKRDWSAELFMREVVYDNNLPQYFNPIIIRAIKPTNGTIRFPASRSLSDLRHKTTKRERVIKSLLELIDTDYETSYLGPKLQFSLICHARVRSKQRRN
ncbi:hypothetical protein TcasGA2_TC008894 [Tribolium castaneum]|uniref:Uncharacterized protein n=1 Tax=Tribolium castaneum TaxID=7070 RepID=D6WQL7_TRICA|nr:hypothetical protein TcasGA2_TC008894 [Tribolium castaneum]